MPPSRATATFPGGTSPPRLPLPSVRERPPEVTASISSSPSTMLPAGATCAARQPEYAPSATQVESSGGAGIGGSREEPIASPIEAVGHCDVVVGRVHEHAIADRHIGARRCLPAVHGDYDLLDALHARNGDVSEDPGEVDGAAERPAAPILSPLERMEVAEQRLLDGRLHVGEIRVVLRHDLRPDVYLLVRRRRHVELGGEHSGLIQIGAHVAQHPLARRRLRVLAVRDDNDRYDSRHLDAGERGVREREGLGPLHVPRLRREHLEVLGGHRAAPAAYRPWHSELRFAECLFVATTDRGEKIADLAIIDAVDGNEERLDLSGSHVAELPAAEAVAPSHDAAVRLGRVPHGYRPVGAIPELDLTGRSIQQVVAIARARGEEVVHPGPPVRWTSFVDL